MSAFNKRFQSFEIWGLPGAGVLGIVFGLVGGLMFMLVPVPLNVFLGFLGLVGIAVGIVAFVMGDEFQWISIKLLSRLESGSGSIFGKGV